MTKFDRVYVVGKSFRNESSDFRHLTEFRHAEYEGFGSLEDILIVQERMIRYLIQELVENCEASLHFFLSDEDFKALDLPAGQFARVTFDEAFSELYRESKDTKYHPDSVTVASFDAKAEVLLTELVGDAKPVFVTYYPLSEVAFYHAVSPTRPTRAINADLLFPGYGEVVGSGQRVFGRADYERKRDLFRLRPDDYDWYGEIRESEKNTTSHSGFGLGLERFLAAVLKLPTLVQAISFPRVHWAVRP